MMRCSLALFLFSSACTGTMSPCGSAPSPVLGFGVTGQEMRAGPSAVTLVVDDEGVADLGLSFSSRGYQFWGESGLYLKVHGFRPGSNRLPSDGGQIPTQYDDYPEVECLPDGTALAHIEVRIEDVVPGRWTFTANHNLGADAVLGSVTEDVDIEVVDN